MRRLGKILAWTLVVLFGFAVLLVAVVLVGANIGPGRRLIAHYVPDLTGGEVHIAGLAGRFPDRLRIATVQLDDAHGPYLTLHGLVLNWSPFQLVRGVLDIGVLDARTADLARMPVSRSSAKSSGLPVSVTLHQFGVARFTIAPAVAGRTTVVALQGAGALTTAETGSGHLTVRQVGGSGRYALSGDVTRQRIQATLTVQEQAHGLIATLAGLPDIGPIDLHAALDGPRDAIATQLAASAGPLRADAAGTVDLTHKAADLTVTASAPAMTPRPDVSWQSIDLHAHVQGTFTAPNLSGRVTIAGLHAVGAGIAQLTAELSGNAGQAQVHAVLDKLTLPGQDPTLFAAAPMVLDASAQLDAPGRPVHFTLQHPLVQARGIADTKTPEQAKVTVTLPQLAPLAAVAGQTVQGHTVLTLTVARQDDTTSIGLQGTLGITGGLPQAEALLGNEARLELAARLSGHNAWLDQLHVSGRGADVTAHGSLVDQRAALDWSAAVTDLGVIDPKLNGRIDATGEVSGPEQNLSAAVALHGEVGAEGVNSGPVTVEIHANGLPNRPSGAITAQGELLNAPIDLAAAVSRTASGIDLTVQHADWKSLQAQGALTLPKGATIPQGTLHLQMTHLADLRPLLGRPLSGGITAALDASAQAAHLTLAAQDLAMSGSTVARASLDATIAHPQANPDITATLAASGVRSGSVSGASARLEARGTQQALAMTLRADAPNLSGSAARVTAAATVDVPGRALALQRLNAAWKGQDLRLLAPARLDLVGGATVEHLRLGLRQAVLTVNGRISPALDLTASLRDLPASLADAVSPALKVGGTIGAEARLTGTLAKPAGTVRLTATDLRDNSITGRALPPANLRAEATLHGTDAALDLRLTAGRSHLVVTGTAPLATTGAVDLHADGAVDLALANPILTAEGRRVRGELTLAVAVAGTPEKPRITGSARLSGGEAQDYPMGVHITDLAALVQANGDTVRLVRLSGRAGPGSIGASGTVTLAAPMPIDLVITADNARLLASPLITARIGSRLTVRGDLEGMMTLAGAVHVEHALVQIPNVLPSSVAVLPVRVAGAPPPKPAPPAAKRVTGPTDIALDMTLDTPGEVIVRGRGLNVALGGTVHIRGTAANPQPSGGLTLQRGTMSLISQTLTFNEGSIDFVGAGITDPGIHLVATSSNSSITATLTVSGTAKDPKITLSSTPPLPQDEILAQLLFNQSISSLSPFQVASIAAGLAQLSGKGGAVANPLEGVRNALGLDQLTVGSNSSGAPTVEAGRYLAPGVYLGAQQSATGNGTQATLQVNLGKGLKLEGSAGTGTASATGAASTGQAASLGLTYQFQY